MAGVIPSEEYSAIYTAAAIYSKILFCLFECTSTSMSVLRFSISLLSYTLVFSIVL